MNWNKFYTKTHKWMGLILAVQIVLWFISGVVMSVLDLDEVHGDFTRANHAPPYHAAGAELLPIGDVIAAHGPANRVELTHMAERPIYRVTTLGGLVVVDAVTGAVLTPLSAEDAMRIAIYDFNGDPRNASDPVLLYENEVGYSGPLPVWRVNMNDETDLRIYVSPTTARVVGARNNVWRIFDFFWMLHIMDYDERSDFNTWWLRLFTIVSTLFVITGVALLFYRFKRSDFGLK